jgi:hypothetical protein
VRRTSLALCVLAASSCVASIEREPVTQVLLRVDASAEIRSGAQQLRVRTFVQRTQNGEWAKRTALTIDVARPERWPVDIPITPSEPTRLPYAFQVTVEALDADGSMLADARAITRFIRTSQRLLEITLARCGGRPIGSSCEPDMNCRGTSCRSCVRGRCQPIGVVDPRRLGKLDRTAIERGPSSPNEADVPDAGSAVPADGSAGSSGSGAVNLPGSTAEAGSGGIAGAGGSTGQAGSPAVPPSGGLTALAWGAQELLEHEAAGVQRPALARNRAGDLALAWWQDAPSGYIWMRRYRGGTWDTTPFSVDGPTRPTRNYMPPAIGIDRDGVAQIFFFGATPESGGVPVRGYWVRWNGEPSIMLDAAQPSGPAGMGMGMSSSVGGNQSVTLPVMLAVAEDSSASALWLGPRDRNTGLSPVYVNAIGGRGWGTPDHFLDLRSEYAPPFWSAVESSSRHYASVINLTRTAGGVADALVASVGHADVAPSPSRIDLPEPLLGGVDLEVDAHGDAIAFFLLAADPASPHAFSMRYRAATAAWSAPQRVSEQVVKSGDLAALPSGDPLAVWFEASSGVSTGQLALSRYTDASGWQQPTAIGQPFEIEEPVGLKVATNSSGEILIVWTQMIRLNDGTFSKALLAARSDGSGAFSEPSVITSYVGVVELVGTTWSDAGRAVVVWAEAAAGSTERDLKWIRSQ